MRIKGLHIKKKVFEYMIKLSLDEVSSNIKEKFLKNIM